jgi:hypothetical protein
MKTVGFRSFQPFPPGSAQRDRKRLKPQKNAAGHFFDTRSVNWNKADFAGNNKQRTPASAGTDLGGIT